MEIKYKKRFEKALKKLQPKIKKQFFVKLDIFLENKIDRVLNNHSVGRVYVGCSSIDITGDYRAIFLDEENVVTFVMIGTHSQLYK